jgi:hypothetical protein
MPFGVSTRFRRRYEPIEMTAFEPQQSMRADSLVRTDANKPTLTSLPTELLAHIASYLNPLERARFSQVCPQLHDVAESAWEPAVTRDIPFSIAHNAWVSRFRTFPSDFRRAYLQAAHRGESLPNIFAVKLSFPDSAPRFSFQIAGGAVILSGLIGMTTGMVGLLAFLPFMVIAAICFLPGMARQIDVEAALRQK